MARRATATGNLRQWDPSDTVLHLNVGSAGRTHRAQHRGRTTPNEMYIVEQIAGDANSATIKVTAFGRSNTYEDVQSIQGTFGDGNDTVIIGDSVKIPVIISATAATTPSPTAAATRC